MTRAVIFGRTGGIGGALADCLSARDDVYVISGSRCGMDHFNFDFSDESSLARAAALVGEGGPVDLIFVATGLLHRHPAIGPEKSWAALDPTAMTELFAVNTIGPAMIAKHFLPLLHRDRRAVFAALSARVGSIEDNRLGGWHSYRSSKAALNMLIRNFAIELARRNPEAIAVALHPGTVDTALSQPFQRRVPSEQLFSPARSAAALLNVIAGLTPADSGGFFSWDGARIAF